MPIYDFKCTVCEKDITVLRTMSDSDVPPSEEEIGASEDKQCQPTEHKWQKVIGSFTLTRGKNWRGAKGYW